MTTVRLPLRPLAGKVVLITGASSGIGAATALACAQAGATLALCARRRARLEEVAATCRAAGAPRVLAVTIDIADGAGPAQFVNAARALGPADVLVCNAGSGWTGPFANMPLEAIHRLVDTNYVGTLLSARSVLPEMLRRQTGVIVMVTSVTAFLPVPYMALYCGTKHAVAGFAHALQGELRGTGVRVAIIYPASTATEFHDHAPMRSAGPEAPAEEVAARIVRAMLQPRDDVLDLAWRFRYTTQPILARWRQRAMTRGFRSAYPELKNTARHYGIDEDM